MGIHRDTAIWEDVKPSVSPSVNLVAERGVSNVGNGYKTLLR